jgi:hypothetical protein
MGSVVDIIDIPDQVAKALKYSLRSRSAFFTSLVTAMLVCGIAYDLVYAFWYVRFHNVKDAEFGWPYFVGFLLLSIMVPLGIGALAYFHSRAQLRPFKRGQIGIAIAPFEVFSVAPETLGTANVLHALDIVSTEFFRVVQSTLNEYEIARDFEFRFLPQYARITTELQAVKYRAELSATMVVWGMITQRSQQPMDIRFNLQASSSYTFSDLTIERFPMLPLQYFIFFEAAKTVLDCEDTHRVKRVLDQARPLGEQLDKKLGGTSCVDSIDALLLRTQDGGDSKNAAGVSSSKKSP